MLILSYIVAKRLYEGWKLSGEFVEFVHKEAVETGTVFLDTEFTSDGAVYIVVPGSSYEGTYLFAFESHRVEAAVSRLPCGETVGLQVLDKFGVPYRIRHACRIYKILPVGHELFETFRHILHIPGIACGNP